MICSNFIPRELRGNEVYEVWTEILLHKVSMSKVLKRDIAIKVAALDYINSLYQKIMQQTLLLIKPNAVREGTWGYHLHYRRDGFKVKR